MAARRRFCRCRAGSAALSRDWATFESADWASTGHADPGAWFPAWYVVQHPGAAAEIAQAGAHDSPAADAAVLLVSILDLERQGNSPQLTQLRKRLQGLNLELFSQYMAHRTVFHR